MGKDLYLNVNDERISKDDLLIDLSEIPQANRSIYNYKYLNEIKLQTFYKNKEPLARNLKRLEEDIQKNHQSIKLVQLNKNSPKINGEKFLQGETDKKTIKNIAVVVFLKEKLYEYNEIVFFCDIERKHENLDNKNLDSRNLNINFLFKINRIEFLDQNKNTFLTSTSKNNINLKLSSGEKQLTDLPEIRSLINNAEAIFEKDDYEADGLQINKWFDFLKIMFEVYKVDDDKVVNQIVTFNKNKYLLSQYEYRKSKSDVLDIASQNKTIKIDQIKNLEKDVNIDKIIEKKETENKGKINQLRQKNEDLENTINSYKKNIVEEEEKIQNFNSALDILKNNLNEIQINLNNLKTSLKESKDKNLSQSLQDKINESGKNFNEQNELKQEYELKIKQLSNSINNNKDKIRNTDNNITNNKKNISAIEKEQEHIKHFRNLIKKNKYKYFYEFSQIELNKKELKEKDDNDDLRNWDKFISEALETNEMEEISVVSKDFATYKKISRMWFALRQLNSGYYKNYYLYKAIKTPTEISYSNEIPQDVQNKYNLNTKQKEVVRKAINTNDIFYLQGPPGTGKTHTLCAISESILKENKNLVMCSSTHEAISNFLEKLADYNKDNPNLIIFKYRFGESREDQFYSEEKLFSNFKNAIYEFILPQNNKSSLKDLIENYKTKYQTLKAPKMDGKWLFKSFFNLVKKHYQEFNNREELTKIIWKNEEYLWPFQLTIFSRGDLTKDNVNDFLLKSTIDSFYNRIANQPNYNYQQIKDFDEIIDAFDFQKEDLQYLNEDVLEYLNTKTNQDDLDDFQIRVKEARKHFDQINDQKEEKFLKYIFDNNLINVIGITTTSRQSIEIGNETKNLFSQYPVDTILIDEISKSSTPEILTKIVLAKKIILSGDYLQLPPSPEFNSEYDVKKIIDYLSDKYESNSNDKKDLLHKQWIELIEKNKNNKNNENENNENSNQLIRLIQDEINKLFKTSFFVTQIEKMKQKNLDTAKRSFEFLQESRRFSGDILEVVNLIYPYDEKLIAVNETIKKFNLRINDRNLDNEFVVIDTSKIDWNYFEKYHEIDITKFSNSVQTFDQSGSPFKIKNDQKTINIQLDNSSTYNQYSALVIVNLAKKLLDQNPNQINNKNRIAIITLTKNQKSLVNQYLKIFFSDKSYKHLIKVDTIDNFQGREEEIVIVDFIRGKTKIENTKSYQLPKRNLTFLEEIERINVALSRAKSKLILIGAFERYLSGLNNKLFRQYQEIAKDKSNANLLYERIED